MKCSFQIIQSSTFAPFYEFFVLALSTTILEFIIKIDRKKTNFLPDLDL